MKQNIENDLGHKWTDEELKRLEKKILKVYSRAEKDIKAVIDDYFERFENLDKKKREQLVKGLISETDYKIWRNNKIMTGQRYKSLQSKISNRMTNANSEALKFINGNMINIYAENRNYAEFLIENGELHLDIDYTLWDEETVKMLIKDSPELMPNYPKEKALKRGIDLEFGRKQIQKEITTGILLGESNLDIAARLRKSITSMNVSSSIRTARTAATSAQNGGRYDSYLEAEKMGLKFWKIWLATLDSHTRTSHALLDGERVEVEEKFSNGLKFPGDPDGDPGEVYNCRCSMITQLKGFEYDINTDRFTRLENMTYDEWKEYHRNKLKNKGR